MKKITYFICVSLLAAALAGCSKDETAPVGDSKTPVLAELTETSINGTALKDGVDIAGVIKDKDSGKGIAGISVTDGYTFVKTDANGVYQMQRNSLSRNVYFTVPAAYMVPLDETYHLPAFFSPGVFAKGKAYRCDFELKKLDAPETDFTLLMIGDPQCQTIDETGRFITETIPDIRRTMESGTYSGNVYALTLGDLTFDSYYMFNPMLTALKNVVAGGRYLPVFNSVGNHDHNSLVDASGDKEMDDYNSLEAYVERFGPTDYSFDRGNAHIVVMDNVLVSTLSSNSSPNKKTWNYTNELTDTQMEWLRQDIANVQNPGSKMIIFCTHQPIRKNDATGNYAEVMSILSTFGEAHIMVGHTHYTQNYIHQNGEQEVYEHVHGAACGAWWNANTNVTGAPNGYNIYNVNGSKIKDWVLKPTGYEATYQMRVYDGDQEYLSESNPEGTKYKVTWYTNCKVSTSITLKGNANFQHSFVAEVFDDDAKYWTLEFWQNGQKVGDFTRAADSGICNMALCAYWFNDKSKSTDTWASTTASHYWYFTPASGKPSEEQNWEVRAVHNFPNGSSATYTCNELTTDYSKF